MLFWGLRKRRGAEGLHAAKKEDAVGGSGVGGDVDLCITGVQRDDVEVLCEKGENGIGEAILDDQKRGEVGRSSDLKSAAIPPEKHAVAIPCV